MKDPWDDAVAEGPYDALCVAERAARSRVPYAPHLWLQRETALSALGRSWEYVARACHDAAMFATACHEITITTSGHCPAWRAGTCDATGRECTVDHEAPAPADCPARVRPVLVRVW